MFEKYETKVKIIPFSGHYISGEAEKAIRDTTKNILLVKGSTGVGATTAKFNTTEGHQLIISPNVGMIKGKEDEATNGHKFDSKKQFFRYGESVDQWSTVKDYLDIYDNVVINTTPNQIINLRSQDWELYNKLRTIHPFVDESHAYASDADYRNEMGIFKALLFNEWKTPYQLSTATPIFRNLDIPKNQDIEIIKVVRDDQQIKPLQISNRKKDAKQFIQREHLNGTLVICFTNDINYHKSFTTLRVKNLVGKVLDTKLKPFERGLTPLNELYDNTDVIFLSSSYMAGYDVNEDCSICIVSDQKSDATKINVNNVVQAYGRCRETVKNALFVNILSPTTAKIVDGKKIVVHNKPITLGEVNKSIEGLDTKINYFQKLIDEAAYYTDLTEYKEIIWLNNVISSPTTAKIVDENKDAVKELFAKILAQPTEKKVDGKILVHNKPINKSIENEVSSSQGYVNRDVILAPILSKVDDYQLYNESVLKEALEGYGFEISKYENKDEELIIPRGQRKPFDFQMSALLALPLEDLRRRYLDTKRSLQFKGEGNFHPKLVFYYLTAYLLKKTNGKRIIEMLDNSRVRPNEFFNSMDLFLRANVDTTFYFTQPTNNQLNKINDKFDIGGFDTIEDIKRYTDDWLYLYAWYLVTNNILPFHIEREISLYLHFNNVDICKKFVHDKMNRSRNAFRAILRGCKNDKLKLNTNDEVRLKKVITSIYNALDKGETYAHNNSRKNIKNKLTNAILFFLTDGQIDTTIESKNREYNAITSLPTNMRSIIPIKYISLDISSANPQIIDSILGTSIWADVYTNLMTKRNLKRNEAKVLFNSALNNHHLTTDEANDIYLDAGYPPVKALELAMMTANSKKGAFYEIMTAHEKQLMLNYSDILPVKSFRFHDGLIIKLEDLVNHNVELSTTVKGVTFHTELFNSNEKIELGLTDNDPADKMLNNYTYTKG